MEPLTIRHDDRFRNVTIETLKVSLARVTNDQQNGVTKNQTRSTTCTITVTVSNKSDILRYFQMSMNGMLY